MKPLTLYALLTVSLAVGTAAQGATIVFPTGHFPDDVQSVQAALDQGGSVMLKATDPAGTPTAFNFGPAVAGSGFVTLTRDAELLGEHLSNSESIIAGGNYPVRAFDAIRSAVRDLTFSAPLHGAIFFIGPFTADTEITGNRVSHVVGELFAGFGTVGEALVIGGGRVVINDNDIESVDADNGIGITQLDSAGPVEVLRNRVSGTSTNSIECTRNHGLVMIADNIVRPGPTPDGFGGYGIEVNGTGNYVVSRNDILIETPGAIGIFAFGAVGFGFGAVSNPVIDHNHVVMQPIGTIDGSVFNDGIDLGGLVSGAYVGNNRISGSGFSAFSLFDASFDPSQPSDLGFNTYVGNNIAQVSANVADVFLDDATHDTVLKGMSGTVLDLGTNNRIAGFTKKGQPGTGLQVSKAVHLRNRSHEAAAMLP